MKRFICALIILAATITSAAVINNKAINAADEIIYSIDCGNTDKTVNLWNEHKLLFSLILNQSEKEKIQNKINRIKEDKSQNEIINLKDEISGIKNSMILNFENIL